MNKQKEKKELEATIHRAFMRGMAIGSVITILLVYIILFIVATFPSVSAATSIQPTTPQPLIGCKDIDAPGYYKLGTNLAFNGDHGDGYCIDINSDNVILDGKGHYIRCSGDPDLCDYAIGSSGWLTNVTIMNLTIKNIPYGTGMDLADINHLFVHDLTIFNCSEGIWFGFTLNNSMIYNNYIYNTLYQDDTETDALDFINMKNVSVYHNKLIGNNESFWFSHPGKDSKIYDNYISSNTKDVGYGYSYNTSQSSTSWNIPKTRTLGPNIIGGQYIAGNYWAKPNGRGLSQTCSDNNGDGICDYSCMYIGWNNYDFSPITNHGRGPIQSMCNIAVR